MWQRDIWVGVALSALLISSGCSFDDKANDAHGCDGCAPGMCVLNYCLQAAGDGNGGDGNGGDGNGGDNATAGKGGDQGTVGTSGSGGGAGTTSGPCAQGAACFVGSADNRGKGVCTDGKSKCDAGGVLTCEGQVVPSDEQCNKLDDDCDGDVDEELMLGSCMGAGKGTCGSSVLKCEDGNTVCVDGEAVAEICNGLDDDCDGTIDNDISALCYPDDADGCRRKGDGTYECTGSCAAGTQKCEGGKLSECTGFVKPVEEVCGVDPAQDDDCNRQVDDDCPCPEPNFLRRCFPGPGLWFAGICQRGTQECVDGKLGDCVGAIVGRDETCDNMGMDDDCNGAVDDVPGVGGYHSNCDPRGKGICRAGWDECVDGAIECVPREAEREIICDDIDEACNGASDEREGPELETDENNCGACGEVCPGGDLCCDGDCKPIADDELNCGRCGTECPANQDCCSGACKRTDTDDESNCGGCGITCTDNKACCDGSCLGTTDDESNCGGCGITCTGGAACCGGMCKPMGDPVNCTGVCDSCSGSVCCAGACQQASCSVCCGGTTICCGTACVEPAAEGGGCPVE